MPPPADPSTADAHQGHFPCLTRRAGLAWLAGLAALSGCATTTPGGVVVDRRHVARGQDSRVLFLVLHYTVGDFGSALRTLTQGEVSSHYLVSDENPPRIYQLVDEGRRAWHAGESAWQGHRGLNASSIGIEVVNPGPRWGAEGRQFERFPEAQIDLLLPLVKDIVQRHGIRPDRVLGHSDVQPQRKQDPGPLFPWARLAAAGLVRWPDAQRVAAARPAFELQLPDLPWFQQRLARHGFELAPSGRLDTATRNVLAAFQMKYRPARFDGQPDAETAALLAALTDELPA